MTEAQRKALASLYIRASEDAYSHKRKRRSGPENDRLFARLFALQEANKILGFIDEDQYCRGKYLQRLYRDQQGAAHGTQ